MVWCADQLRLIAHHTSEKLGESFRRICCCWRLRLCCSRACGKESRSGAKKSCRSVARLPYSMRTAWVLQRRARGTFCDTQALVRGLEFFSLERRTDDACNASRNESGGSPSGTKRKALAHKGSRNASARQQTSGPASRARHDRLDPVAFQTDGQPWKPRL